MTVHFAEKLAKLTENENKIALSERAGLPPKAISNYISKRQTPQADKALAIARVLNVPLDWLVDDQQTMPKPKQGRFVSLASFATDDLLDEIHVRLIREFNRAQAELQAFWKRDDWQAVAVSLYETADGASPPAEARQTQRDIERARQRLEKIRLDFDLMGESGAALIDNLEADFDRLRSDNEGFDYIVGFPQWKPEERPEVLRILTDPNYAQSTGRSLRPTKPKARNRRDGSEYPPQPDGGETRIDYETPPRRIEH
ncbi:MAG: helix-turn-helix transcriptional regulator [Planctomycetota bacterium]